MEKNHDWHVIRIATNENNIFYANYEVHKKYTKIGIQKGTKAFILGIT